MKYIDLFAGCGGLSLGLEAAGLKLALAVEKSPMAAETFYHNLISPLKNGQQWETYRQDQEKQIRQKLFVGEIGQLLENPDLISHIGNIDLVTGGPPCQGFSLAGKRNPMDQRNNLPFQFIKYIENFEPKAFLMENVVGMRHNFTGHGETAAFHQIRQHMEEQHGYIVQELQLNAMHYGVAQHRPRVFLLGIRGDIAKDKKLVATDHTWHSDDYYKQGDVPPMCPKPVIRKTDKWNFVEDAIHDLDKHETMSSDKTYVSRINKTLGKNVKTRAKLSRNPEDHANHVERRHSTQVKKRFALYHVLNPVIFNLAAEYNDASGSAEKTRIRRKINKMIMDDAVPDEYMLPNNDRVYKDKEELKKIVIDLATKKHSQRALNTKAPSPTVVSIPDDVVHPTLPRTMTVREQARFQSFPDNFVFRGKVTTGGQMRKVDVPQYTQVGNAVPPMLAYSLAMHIKKLIE